MVQRVLRHGAVHATEGTGRATMSRTARGLASLAAVPAVLVPVYLLTPTVPLRDVVVYAAWFAFGVLGPGVLVARAVIGRTPLFVGDLGIGAAVGLVIQLGAWAALVALGVGDLFVFWPLVVYAVFVAVPGLRPHLRRQPRTERLGPVPAWTLAAAASAVAVALYPLARTSPLPPAANSWYPDLYWHLGLVQLFMRQVAPEDSQVAGAHLAYHWFANADVAAASLATGLPPTMVMTRLWVIPMVLATMALLVAVARELTDRHAGVVAAIAAVLMAGRASFVTVPWAVGQGAATFAPFSLSQNYSYPLLLLTVLLLVRWLRGGPRAGLVPLAVLLGMSSGIKATHGPVIVSGLLVALVLTAVARRPVGRVLTALALAGVSVVAGTVLIGAGGASGARVQLFSTLRRSASYLAQTGLTPAEAALPGGLLPAGVGRPGAAAVLVLLALAMVMLYLWVLPGLTLFSRDDCVPAFLAGGGLSGLALMLVVDQSGLSQVYFMSTSVVLWFLLAGWAVVALWDRRERGLALPARIILTAAGTLAVCVPWLAARRVAGELRPAGDLVRPLAVPLAVTVSGLVACAVVLWFVGRRPAAPVHTVALGMAAGLVVLSVSMNLWSAWPPALTRYPVGASAAETDAALWLDEHADPHDVVATNVHCLGSTAGGRCDARAFWVSALSGRRTLIGGWGYLDQTRAMHGQNGKPSPEQPFYDQELFALNEQVFEAPTPEGVDALRERGVSWLFADSLHGPVSDRLGSMAELAYRTSDVTVYRILPAGPSPS